MSDQVRLRSIDPIQRLSVADQVFETLYAKVLSLELTPGTKLSEADVAKQLDVSRQPVRDAFYRLAQQGFLNIRPQRATVVSQISARDISKAKFIRTALEVETLRRACAQFTDAQIDALEALLPRQQAAIDAQDKALFHLLDDQFHRQICDELGLSFTWDVIREMKAHTDRVRYQSLSFASQSAHDEHQLIVNALRARDPQRAEVEIRAHLSKIDVILQRLRQQNHAWFQEEE